MRSWTLCACDIDFDDIRFSLEVITPDPLVYQAPFQHLARIANKKLQEVEFLGGEFDSPVTTRYLSRASIQANVTEAENFAVCRMMPAEKRFHPRQRF